MKITRKQLQDMIIKEAPELKEAGRRRVQHDYADLPRDEDGKVDLTINFGDPWVIGPGNDDPYVYGDEIINVPENPIELRETKITRSQLQDIIIKEAANLGISLGTSHRPAKKKKSQIHQFSETKSGKRVAEAGQKIKKAGNLIREVGEDQVGAMAESLNNIAEFVEKMGGSLSGLNELNEDSSLTDTLPTVQEFKKVLKEIQKLEK